MQGTKSAVMQMGPVVAALLAAVASAPAFAQGGAAPLANPAFSPATSTASIAPPADTAPDSNVWNWQDVPKNQQIVIDRAVFDQGGYQLFCHTGETIVVPFVNQNLYVMKFGQCDGPMYFITDGATPVLYVPFGGSLENATAAGARWYPFPRTFDYLFPVYVGPAPDWDEYASMGWYPGMVYYGGYWGNTPYVVGIVYAPTPGWFVSIDGFEIDGWLPYREYVASHPAQRRFAHDQPGYRYDRLPRRGPEAIRDGTPFGKLKEVRPTSPETHSHYSSLANPTFRVHADLQVVVVASHYGNPNLIRPATAAAVQIANVRTKPVILGNPRFLPQSAMTSLPNLRIRPISEHAMSTLTTENPRLTARAASVLDSRTHKPLFDKHGSRTGNEPPLLSTLSGKKSSHGSGFFQKAIKSASSWVRDYAKSAGGGGSDSRHSETSGHSEHSERESKPSSVGEKKK